MDAIDLFIGSEGTLGVFTRIKLSLLSYPERVFSAVIFLAIGAGAIFQVILTIMKWLREENRGEEHYINMANEVGFRHTRIKKNKSTFYLMFIKDKTRNR